MTRECDHIKAYPSLDHRSGYYCPDCGRGVSVSVSTSNQDAYGKPSQAVYAVPSHGRRYYRYVVSQGHQVVESLHIPGGNVNNPVALARAWEVSRWIRSGRSPRDIIQLIRSWR